MCLNAECVTGAGRSWKSCWNGGSLVYTNAFTNLKGAFLCVTSIICFWVLCCVAVGAFSPAHLRWIIAETLLLFPNALEAGSLNCCLFGHFFQSFKSLLWKWGGKKKKEKTWLETSTAADDSKAGCQLRAPVVQGKDAAAEVTGLNSVTNEGLTMHGFQGALFSFLWFYFFLFYFILFLLLFFV